MEYSIFASYQSNPNLSLNEGLIYCGIIIGSCFFTVGFYHLLEKYLGTGFPISRCKSENKELSDRVEQQNKDINNKLSE